MNFNSQTVARSIGFRDKLYLAELKTQQPALYDQVKRKYDNSFKVFFTATTESITKDLDAVINRTEFMKTVDVRLETQRRFQKEIQRVNLSSDSEYVGPVIVKKLVKPDPPQDEFMFSDDEFIEPNQLNTHCETLENQLIELQQKYESQKTQIESLKDENSRIRHRYRECKDALVRQRIISQDLNKAYLFIKERCFCNLITDFVNKRNQLNK